MGIDPVTHKSFSHLMAEIATTLGPPQVANLTEAALGCFKDEMLHLLTKKRIDFQLQPTTSQGKVRPRKQVYFFYLFLRNLLLGLYKTDPYKRIDCIQTRRELILKSIGIRSSPSSIYMLVNQPLLILRCGMWDNMWVVFQHVFRSTFDVFLQSI